MIFAKLNTPSTIFHQFCSYTFVFHLFQESQKFNRVLKKLSGESHLLVVDSDLDIPQIFIVIENEVVLELESYQEALFAMVAVHHVFNIHYPKNLKLCFQFLDEYVFGITPLKKNSAVQQRC